MMRELALFAGAGGGILGGILLGWRTVCAIELDPYCRQVLLARQRDGMLPRFPIWDDVRTFDGKPWRGHVDVISGGFPCQDISCAGRGAGIGGERSGLWSEFARIIGEVRPRFAFVENSPNLTTRGLGRVLGDLAEMGFDARWGVLGACHSGAPHQRARIWLVAHSDLHGFKPNDSTTNTGTVDCSTPSLCEQGDTETIWIMQRRSFRMRRIEMERSSRNQWNSISEPGRTIICGLGGMVDGLAHRVDRLRALGNGQVPAVARLAWETLKP